MKYSVVSDGRVVGYCHANSYDAALKSCRPGEAIIRPMTIQYILEAIGAKSADEASELAFTADHEEGEILRWEDNQRYPGTRNVAQATFETLSGWAQRARILTCGGHAVEVLVTREGNVRITLGDDPSQTFYDRIRDSLALLEKEGIEGQPIDMVVSTRQLVIAKYEW